MDNSTLLIIIVVCGCICLFSLIVVVFLLMGNKKDAQVRNLVKTQRGDTGGFAQKFSRGNKKVRDLLSDDDREKALQTQQQHGDSGGSMSLERKLYYAKWNISPVTFRVCQVVIGAVVFLVVQPYTMIVIQLMSLVTGYLMMNALLNHKIKRRVSAFDKDYPQFLLSLVSLLKTGMNPMTAIDNAAKGLEADSSVRIECELMLERLRYGVSEDQSIGSFGEDIAHAEIELFVEALLLSRKVGGTLSDTLERLSKQVRRRQYFRQAAVSAVGLQRGSIYAILFIMIALESYIWWVAPDLVTGAWESDVGWQAWQFGFIVITTGIVWVRTVTNIKV